MSFEAIIFDLDGVICTTDDYHYNAWKHIADKLDIPFDHETNNRLRGISRMDSLSIVLQYYDGSLSNAEKEALAEEKNEVYKKLLKHITTDNLMPKVAETLDKLRSKSIKLAIGSSSKNARFILEKLGLSSAFDAISDGNNITRSKPDPEVFLKAAEYLAIPPAACLVVEDAVAGAQAAHAAGMAVACVGDGAQRRAGDYNLDCISDLLTLMQ